MTRDGLEYLDDQEIICTIDFHTCHENVQKEVSSPGWIRVQESEDVYVGFRDISYEPPFIMFASDPPTCFQFPMPKPAVAVPGQMYLQTDAADLRDFTEFKSRLIEEAGVKTLDLS